MNEKKLRLCFLGDAAAQHLRRWALFFAERGHEVHVISLNDNVLPGYGAAKVHVVRKVMPGASIWARIFSSPAVILSVRKMIRDIAPDIVHSHSACGYAWLGMWSGVKPFLVTPWGSDILDEIRKSAISRFLTLKALSHATLVHTDGENILSELKSLGVPEGKILISRFGVDVELFKPADDREELKKTLGLGGRFIVLSTRTLTPVHDVGTVLAALEPLYHELPDLVGVIVGDGCERTALEELARAHIDSGRMSFSGNIDEPQMVKWLQAADVFVSTSLHESGLSASAAEAMACALPVINTDTGDIRKWIQDGENGYVIPVKSPAMLREKTLKLYSSPAEREAMGRRNREIVLSDFNNQIEMEEIEKCYKTLAGASL